MSGNGDHAGLICLLAILVGAFPALGIIIMIIVFVVHGIRGY